MGSGTPANRPYITLIRWWTIGWPSQSLRSRSSPSALLWRLWGCAGSFLPPPFPSISQHSINETAWSFGGFLFIPTGCFFSYFISSSLGAAEGGVIVALRGWATNVTRANERPWRAASHHQRCADKKRITSRRRICLRRRRPMATKTRRRFDGRAISRLFVRDAAQWRPCDGSWKTTDQTTEPVRQLFIVHRCAQSYSPTHSPRLNTFQNQLIRSIPSSFATSFRVFASAQTTTFLHTESKCSPH